MTNGFQTVLLQSVYTNLIFKKQTNIISIIKSFKISKCINNIYFDLAVNIMAIFIRKYADYNNINYDEFDDILDELSEYCIRLTQ